jgi:DNA-binding XRE family transcriptional regulator
MDYVKLVKKLREKLILTQDEFAKLLGVNYTTVSRWENGLFEPTIKIKRRIVELCKQNDIMLED